MRKFRNKLFHAARQHFRDKGHAQHFEISFYDKYGGRAALSHTKSERGYEFYFPKDEKETEQSVLDRAEEGIAKLAADGHTTSVPVPVNLGGIMFSYS